MRLALLVAVATTAACGAAMSGARGGGAAAWSYDVTVEPSLDAADVRICFDAAPHGWLAPADVEALPALRRAEVVPESGPARPLAATERGLALDGLDAGDCVRTIVDVSGAGPFWARRLRGLEERVVAPESWLWAPSPRREDARIELTLRLPEGIRASVPWDRIGPGRYRLDVSALRWRSFVAFGRFEIEEVPMPGGRAMEVARFGGEMQASPEGIRRWLSESWKAAASLLGTLPPRRVQVVLVPTSSRWGGAVQFGATGRGGGVGIILFPSDAADDEALLTDWVAPHELTHLALPVVPDADAWMSEGFVTYYTEVLRARVGLRTPELAWTTLARGCARGQARSSDPLIQTSASMHEMRSYQRVYWGGAALALTADVEIRRESRGRVSLDTALREIADCCLARRRATSARELLTGVSAAAGGDVLRRLVAAASGRADLPPIDRVLEGLGVRRGDDGVVTLVDDAPDAWIRQAITAPRAPGSGLTDRE